MPHRKVPALHADSRAIPVDGRIDWWRGAVGEIFDITPGSPDSASPDDPHHLRGAWWRYDKLILSTVDYDANHAVRLPRHVRSDQLDHYRLVLKTQGVMHSDTSGRRQIIRPGEILLHDLARPATFDLAAGSSLVLVLPREMLDELLPLPVDLHGVRLQGAATKLLADHLLTMAAHSPEMTVGQAPFLTQATLHLLAASIAPSAQTLARASPAIENTLLRQLCRYVDLHLSEPGLSAEQIAGFFALSRSRLYRLFEPLGGVSAYIKERRLARVHTLLSKPTGRVSLSRLADAHGFKTAEHFSRAFRQQYGYSPKELKQGVLSGLLLATPGPASSDEESFYGWIRSLRD
ncbi:helix-turn-helix domain-containing protein [Variovorax sp. OV329]|uniref:helix-turn-helix domain-containing protein n=1 Tax=Variovorax sp. OV329 TaxID=1882825 RepID=UPI0008E498D9|nr:helix-turn-helix domain-containing protein [Variovorax sp. OV329]SFM92121.1 transcriptional regulator, AraC family [Variovorax sp. OV329]